MKPSLPLLAAIVALVVAVPTASATTNICGDTCTGGGGDPTDAPPTAVITGADAPVAPNATFALSGSSSTDDDAITDYAWDLDDNGSYEASGANQNMSLATVGQHTVHLRVTDTAGQTATTSAIVTVAQAATIKLADSGAEYAGTPADEHVTVERTSACFFTSCTDRITFHATGAPLALAGGNCVFLDATRVQCAGRGTNTLKMDLAGGNDVASVTDGGGYLPIRTEFRGGPGNDTLTGGGGDERFVMDAMPDGADTIAGGAGFDTVDYSARETAVSVSLCGDGVGCAADDGASGEGDTVGSGVEAAVGGSAADTLTGDDGSNVLRGGPGDDVMHGGGGDDTFVAEPSADGKDLLDGGPGSDVADYGLRTTYVNVTLGSGADDGAGGEGDEVQTEGVFGGQADDKLVGDAGPNLIGGGGGNDSITGGAGDDDLRGGDGMDTFVADAGADGNDLLTGGAGIDRADYTKRTTALTGSLHGSPFGAVSGDGETDTVCWDIERLSAGSAADTLDVGPGSGQLDGNGGNDVLTGGPGADVLRGGDGEDTIDGAGGDDTINGDAGNDLVRGGTGVNSLGGDAGDDVFDQGANPDGKDTMVGGAGIDTIDYSKRTHAVMANLGVSGDEGEIDEHDGAGADTENVLGGSGDDTLVGGPGPNHLVGGPGHDHLDGQGGADTLEGGDGDDAIAAQDSIADTVTCGAGVDSATVDSIDTVSGCESVAGGGSTGGGDTSGGSTGGDTSGGGSTGGSTGGTTGGDTSGSSGGSTGGTTGGTTGGDTSGSSGGSTGGTTGGGSGGSTGGDTSGSATPPASDPGLVISLIARNQRISTVIARGVSVLARCSADCSGIVKVTVTPAIARKLGLPVRKGANSVKLGSADLDLDGGTGQTVRIRLSSRAVDALDDATFRVPVTIEAVTDTMSTHISATLRP